MPIPVANRAGKRFNIVITLQYCELCNITNCISIKWQYIVLGKLHSIRTYIAISQLAR